MREFQLLLDCARSEPDAGRIRAFVNEGVDWRTLLELATQHRVRPLVIQSLKSVCWDAVPPTNQLELDSSCKAILVQNFFFTGELLRLLDAFQKNGVAIAAFKGAVLAEAVYGDLSLREFVDLDVVIREMDDGKAEQILNACGYQTYVPGSDFRSAFLSYYGQQIFRGRTGVHVDLHWRLASKNVAFPVQSAELWGRLRNVTIAGRTVPTLANEDLALFLAVHGTKERWRSLIWVCDFAELLRKNEDIEWLALFDLTKRARCSRPLLLAMLLASTLLDAPAPAKLIDKARNDSAVRALVEEAQLGVLNPTPTGEFGELLTGLKTHDLLRHRVWPAATLLMTRTEGDYRAMPLPKSLWGMYYLIRPFRLAGLAAQILVSRCAERVLLMIGLNSRSVTAR